MLVHSQIHYDVVTLIPILFLMFYVVRIEFNGRK